MLKRGRRSVPGRARVAAGEALVRAIYEIHGRSLLAYAVRCTGDQTDAEEIVEDTLMRVWRDPRIAASEKMVVRARLLVIAQELISEQHKAYTADGMVEAPMSCSLDARLAGMTPPLPRGCV